MLDVLMYSDVLDVLDVFDCVWMCLDVFKLRVLNFGFLMLDLKLCFMGMDFFWASRDR